MEPEEPLSEDEWEDEGDEGEEGDEEKDQTSKRRRKAPPVPDDGYPSLWAGISQGSRGFNAEARRVLSALLPGGEHAWCSPTQGRIKLLLQQEVVALLVHPKSPVSRLLCDHNTGSGKTLCMIRIVDNFFFDGRAKIAIFPKDSVVDNFYTSLWEWPSRWRDFCSHCNPEVAKLACNSADWRARRDVRWALDASDELRAFARKEGLSMQQAIKQKLIKTMRDCLEMKRAFYKGKVRKSYLQKQLGSLL